MKHYNFAIIGAGAAGIAAATEIVRRFPDKSCIMIERDNRPGGILLQCIHSGFGLKYLKEELTGPEYAEKVFKKLTEQPDQNLSICLGTTVLKVLPGKKLVCSSRSGTETIAFDRLILASGSREIPFGALSIPSERPAGIFGAGEAQLLINRCGIKPGKTGIILGAGDIGLIMARRLVYEGMRVAAVVEIKGEPGGVRRNVQTCIHDLGIPLMTSSTITRVHGRSHVEGVSVARVNEAFEPDFSTETMIKCDFLLSAVGLMPEIQLAREAGAAVKKGHLELSDVGQTSVDWLYACGNAAKIFPIVDDVSIQSATLIKSLPDLNDGGGKW